MHNIWKLPKLVVWTIAVQCPPNHKISQGIKLPRNTKGLQIKFQSSFYEIKITKICYGPFIRRKFTNWNTFPEKTTLIVCYKDDEHAFKQRRYISRVGYSFFCDKAHYEVSQVFWVMSLFLNKRKMYFLYKEVIQSHEIYLEKHPQVKMN